LGGRDFIRLRIGIGRPRGALDVKEYVLSRFESEERACLEGILLRALEGVESIVRDGVEGAMNRFNVAVICEKRNM
jgi:PTH1 family peptidyl-tRNA hydrolase